MARTTRTSPHSSRSCQPEVGASRRYVGYKVGSDDATISSTSSSTQFCVVGMIADFAGPTPPSGWLVADGRLVSRTTYSKLFAVIGTYFQCRRRQHHFRPAKHDRPGFRRRPRHVHRRKRPSYTLGFTSLQGFVTRTITQAYLPAYNLVTDAQGSHNHTGVTTTDGPWGVGTDGQGTHSHGGGTDNNNLDHYHAGTTDTQGWHQHSLPGTWMGTGNNNRATALRWLLRRCWRSGYQRRWGTHAA